MLVFTKKAKTSPAQHPRKLRTSTKLALCILLDISHLNASKKMLSASCKNTAACDVYYVAESNASNVLFFSTDSMCKCMKAHRKTSIVCKSR